MLAIVLSLAMMLTCLPAEVFAAPEPQQAIGVWTDYIEQVTVNEEGVYEISTPGQLAYVAKGINDGTLPQFWEDENWNTTYYTFRLMVDLDLSAHQWVPIGSSYNRKFTATFDGQGHTITGMQIGTSEQPYSEGYYAGLFGNVSGTVTDVKIESSAVYADVPSGGSETYAGLIAGSLYGSKAQITNCEAAGSVYTAGTTGSNRAYGTAGGVAGNVSQGTLELCRANVTLGVTTNDRSSALGGIAGVAGYDTTAKVQNCIAAVTLDLPEDYNGSYSEVDGLLGVNGGYNTLANSFASIDYGKNYKISFPRYNYETRTNIAYAEKKGDPSVSENSTYAEQYRYLDGTMDNENYLIQQVMTADEMKSDTFLATLNTAVTNMKGAASWSIDAGENDGFPNLKAAGLHQFCKVTFTSNGTTYQTANIISGSTVAEPQPPAREGYNFLYWYSEDENTAYDFETPVTGNLELNAKWDPHIYTINFDSKGGSYIYPQSVARDQKAAEPDQPKKKGAAFGGWYTDSAYENAFSFDTPIIQDMTLYARWLGAASVISVSGRVTDKSSGEGLRGAAVALNNGLNANTDEFGYYRISDVAEGSYTITVTAPGYTAQSQDNFEVSGLSAGYDAALEKKDESTGAQTVNVYATVSCVYTGLMLEGVTVKAVGAGDLGTYTQTTDENGFTLFTGLPTGSYTFYINQTGRPGWESYTSQATQMAGDYNLNCQLKPIYQPLIVNVRGSYDPVTETANVPLAGAKVTAIGVDPKNEEKELVRLSGTTDENGSFTFDELVPITWKIRSSEFAYTETEATIYSNGAGKLSKSDVMLTLPFEESSLSVDMESVYEDPDIFKTSKDDLNSRSLEVELAGVVGTTAEGIIRKANLNEQGKAVFTKLMPGSYRMTASGAAKKNVDITSGDGKEVYGQSSSKKYFEVEFDGRGTANVGLSQNATATLTLTPSPVSFSGTLYKSDMNADGSVTTAVLPNTKMTIKPSEYYAMKDAAEIEVTTDENGHYAASLWPGLYGVEVEMSNASDYTGGYITYYEGMTGESGKGLSGGYSLGWPSAYRWTGSNASAQAYVYSNHGPVADVGGMNLSSGNVVADLRLVEKKVNYSYNISQYSSADMDLLTGYDQEEETGLHYIYYDKYRPEEEEPFYYNKHWKRTYNAEDYHPETRGATLKVSGGVTNTINLTGKKFPYVFNELSPGDYTFTYTPDLNTFSHLQTTDNVKTITFFDFPEAGKLPTSFPADYNEKRNPRPLETMNSVDTHLSAKDGQQRILDLYDGDNSNGELKFRFYSLNDYEKLYSGYWSEYTPATPEQYDENLGSETSSGNAPDEETLSSESAESNDTWYGIPQSKWDAYKANYDEAGDLHWRNNDGTPGKGLLEAVYDDTDMPLTGTYYSGSKDYHGVAIYPKEGTYPDSTLPKYHKTEYTTDNEGHKIPVDVFLQEVFDADVAVFYQKFEYDVNEYKKAYAAWYQREYTGKGFPKAGGLYFSPNNEMRAQWPEGYSSIKDYVYYSGTRTYLVAYSTDKIPGKLFYGFPSTYLPDGNVKLYFCAPKGCTEPFCRNINYIRNQENYEAQFDSDLWFVVDVPKEGLVNCDISFDPNVACTNATVLSKKDAENLLHPRTIKVITVEDGNLENVISGVPATITIGENTFSSSQTNGYAEQTCSSNVKDQQVTDDEWEYAGGGVRSILDSTGTVETFLVPLKRKQYQYELIIKDDAGNPVKGASVKLAGKHHGTPVEKNSDSSGKITVGYKQQTWQGIYYIDGGLTMQDYDIYVSASGYGAQKAAIKKSDFFGNLTMTVTLTRQAQPEFVADTVSMDRKGAFIPGVNYVGGTTNQIEFLADTVLGLSDNPLYMTVEAQIDTSAGDSLQEVFLVDKKAFTKADYSDKPKALTLPSTSGSDYNPSTVLSWIEQMRSGDLGNVYYRRFSSDGGFSAEGASSSGGSHYELEMQVPIWELPPDGFEACLIAVTGNDAVQVYNFDYSGEKEKEQLVGMRLKGDKAKVLNNITIMANAQAATGSMVEKLQEITSPTGMIIPQTNYEAGVTEVQGFLTYEYKLGVKLLQGKDDVSGADSAYMSIAPKTLGISVAGELTMQLSGEEREMTDGYNVTVAAEDLDLMDYLPPLFESLPVKIEFDGDNPPSGSFTLTDGDVYDKSNNSLQKTYTFSANSQVHVNAEVSAFKSLAAVPAVGPVLLALEKSGALDIGAKVTVAAGADGTYKYTIVGGSETSHEVSFTIGAGAGLGMYAKAFGGSLGAEANLKLSGDNEKLKDMVTVTAVIDGEGFRLKDISGKLVADAHIEISTWFINGEQDFDFGVLPFKYEFNTETQYNLTPITVRSTMRSRNDFGVSVFNGKPETVVGNLLPIGGYQTDEDQAGTFAYTDMSAKGGNVRLQLASYTGNNVWNAPATITQTDGLIPAFDVISLDGGKYLAVWCEIPKEDMQKTCPPSVLKYAVGTVSGTSFSGETKTIETMSGEVAGKLRLVSDGSGVALLAAKTAEGALAEKMDITGYKFGGTTFDSGVKLADDQSVYDIQAAAAGGNTLVSYVSEDLKLHTIKWSSDVTESAALDVAGFETAMSADASDAYLLCEEEKGLVLYKWNNGWQKQAQATDMPSPGHPALSVSDGNAYIGWTGENDTKLYSSVYVGGQVSNAEQMNETVTGRMEDTALFVEGGNIRMLGIQGDESKSLNAYGTVIKGAPTVAVPVAKSGLVENGQAQPLVTAGTVTGGTMQYAVVRNAEATPSDAAFAAQIPTGAQAGNYYVWYRVVGDATHFGTNPEQIVVTIAPADDPTPPEQTVQVTFNANGGTGTMADQSMKKDVETALTANTFTRDGYTFLGWAESSTSTTAKYADKASVSFARNMMLYAVWQKKETVTITYNANGGTGTMNAQTVEKGKAATLTASAFTRTGYTFLGWAKSASAVAAEYANKAGIVISADVTLYAVWKKNEDGSSGQGGGQQQGGSGQQGGNTQPTTEVPKEGTSVKDEKTGDSFVIKQSEESGQSGQNVEAAYSAPADSTAKVVEIPDTVTVAGQEIPVTSIEDKAFKGNTIVTEVKIGDNVETIGESAFENCSKLKKVEVSDSVTTIEKKAFSGCKSLTNIDTGKNTTEIGDYAFAGCTKLKKTKIGNRIVRIGSKAFANCKALTSLTIPKSVKKLGAQFASGDNKMKTLIIKNKNLKKKDINKKAFKGIPATCVIKVPKAKVKAYRTMFRKKGLSKKVKVKKA